VKNFVKELALFKKNTIIASFIKKFGAYSLILQCYSMLCEVVSNINFRIQQKFESEKI
jgi:hypothetical protein